MAAPVAATNYTTMLSRTAGNIYSLNESAVNLRTRLSTWRDQFFVLLNNLGNPEEAKIHSWAIPTANMINSMADELDLKELNALVELVSFTISALAFNGYVNASIEASCVAVFNTAWT